MLKKKQVIQTAFGVFLLAAGTSVFADAGHEGEMEVKGTVVEISSNTYLIKDFNGTEHTFQADENTKVEGNIATGDKVEVYIKDGKITRVALED